MGHVGGSVQLRPVGGGREWDCPHGSVTAGTDEVMRARLRRTNHESARG
ncbi:hypothetical protein [Streptomyces sp. WAC 04229]